MTIFCCSSLAVTFVNSTAFWGKVVLQKRKGAHEMCYRWRCFAVAWLPVKLEVFHCCFFQAIANSLWLLSGQLQRRKLQIYPQILEIFWKSQQVATTRWEMNWATCSIQPVNQITNVQGCHHKNIWFDCNCYPTYQQTNFDILKFSLKQQTLARSFG